MGYFSPHLLSSSSSPVSGTSGLPLIIGTKAGAAIESADIILMHDSLHGLADTIAESKATLRNIKQNLFGAFVYNVAGVLYPFFGLLLSPVIIGLAMAFSSLTVVTNANRLRLFKARNH